MALSSRQRNARLLHLLIYSVVVVALFPAWPCVAVFGRRIENWSQVKRPRYKAVTEAMIVEHALGVVERYDRMRRLASSGVRGA